MKDHHLSGYTEDALVERSAIALLVELDVAIPKEVT
jgi:hypothetical protein